MHARKGQGPRERVPGADTERETAAFSAGLVLLRSNMERPISYRPQPVEPKALVDDDPMPGKYCILCLEPPAPSTLMCGTCKIPLCGACFQKHSTVPRFSSHKKIPYEDSSWCSTHFKRQILYCETCSQKCCLICANFGTHKLHSIVDREVSVQMTLAKEAEEVETQRQSVYQKLLATADQVQAQLQELETFEAEGRRKIKEEAERRRKDTEAIVAKTKEEMEKLRRVERSGEDALQQLKDLERTLQDVDELSQPQDFSVVVSLAAPQSDMSFPDNPSSIHFSEEEVAVKLQPVGQSTLPLEIMGEQDPRDFTDQFSLALDEMPEEQPSASYIYTLFNDSDKVIRFDMRTEVWDVQTADRPWQKFCNFVKVDNNSIIATGGGHTPSRRTFQLELKTFTTMEKQQMIIPRNHHGLVKLGEAVLAIGGICKTIQSNCEIFDLEKQTWTEVARLNRARAALGACVLQDQAYVFGGWDGHVVLKSIERFSLASARWQELPLTLPVGSQCNAVVYQSRILVFAFQAGFVYEVLADRLEEFGRITNEAWCRPELSLYNDCVYSFRSGELKLIKYQLKLGKFTVLTIEQ